MLTLVWIVAGLVAGWLARRIARGSSYGVLQDLTLGLLGGVVGGWLLSLLGAAAPSLASLELRALAIHVGISVTGAVALLAGARALTSASRNAAVAGEGIRARFRNLDELERRILRSMLRREPVARDPNAAFDAQLGLGDRLADRLAVAAGSWTFIGIFAAVLLAWIAFNNETARPFDPFPYILLNLALSCLAAIQAPVILMSQNRQAAKDRSDASHDYAVNLKAEMEILALHEKLDALREREWTHLLELQERQLALLEALERQRNGAGDPPVR